MPIRKPYNELYREYATTSLCSTTVIGKSINPDFVHIRLAGPIANVPALKNMKMQGTNILRPEAKVKFDLMTRAFQKSVNFQVPQFEKNVEVFCFIECAYRKSPFDEDNVLTSIRDWLEPSHIRKGDRGWGVAVVPNDNKISAYAIKKKKTDKDPLITEIYLRPLNDVREARDEFLTFVAEGIKDFY